MANKYCSNCGKPLPDGVKFCPECGANVNIHVSGEKHPINANEVKVIKKPNSQRRKWAWIAIVSVIALIAGCGWWIISHSNGAKVDQVADSTMIGDISIPAGKYTIILYDDNTGDFLSPTGSRICGLTLSNGRTEPMTLSLTKTILMLGYNTHYIYIYRDRLFADYGDYYNYTSNYQPDKSAGIPIIKKEKDRTSIYAFDIPKGQIDSFNAPKHVIGSNQNNEYTLILYDDESGHLFDSDGSHVCGLKKGISSSELSLRLNKTISIYNVSTDYLYIKNNKLYTASSDYISDDFAHDGDISKRKVSVRKTEEGDAVIYRFSRTIEPAETIHNDRKPYSSTYNSTSGLSSGSFNVSSTSDLESKLPGTIWTSRPTNGDMWYRLEFKGNHRVDIAYASASLGKWKHYDELWYWEVKEAYASDTGAKYYNVALRQDYEDYYSVSSLAFFNDGRVFFKGPNSRQHNATKGDFNWE